MSHEIYYTDLAEVEIQEIVKWWSEHRSLIDADRWLEGFAKAINSLREHPDRLPYAVESKFYPTGLRQLNFGIGRRITHRILYTIKSDQVWIVRVRHVARNYFSEDELN